MILFDLACLMCDINAMTANYTEFNGGSHLVSENTNRISQEPLDQTYACLYSFLIIFSDYSKYWQKILQNLWNFSTKIYEKFEPFCCSYKTCIIVKGVKVIKGGGWRGKQKDSRLPPLPHQVKTQYLHSDFMQTSFFYLGRFLKKLGDDQCSSITKGSIYHIRHMYIHPFTTVIDFPEIGCLMEVSDYVLYLQILCFYLVGQTLINAWV